MRKLFLTAALGLLLTACSTINPTRHEGKDTLPQESKELVPVYREVVRQPFSVENVAKAVKEKKIIVIYMHSPYCHWCERMDQEVWAHPEIATVVNKAYAFLDLEVSASQENLQLFVKYLDLFQADPGIPLTIAIFPRISPEDESVMPEVIPTTMEEVDALFASTLSLTWSGYSEPTEMYQDFFRLGILYNRKFDAKQTHDE